MPAVGRGGEAKILNSVPVSTPIMFRRTLCVEIRKWLTRALIIQTARGPAPSARDGGWKRWERGETRKEGTCVVIKK